MDETTRRIPPPGAPASARAGKLAAYGESECGPVRKGNEDAFAIDLNTGLFIVADGMGGHAAGEVASRLAVEAILAFVARSDGEEDMTWPFEFDQSLSLDANRLRTAVHLANRRVFQAGASHPDYNGMGTTVVAVLFTASSVVVAHAGDSRVYGQHDGKLTPLTKDDSLVEEASAALEAWADENPGRPPRNVVTNVLGAYEQARVHVSERERAPGTVLLLCSDGVHGALDGKRIGDILATQDGLEQQAERLVAEAIAAGGRDNATAVVVMDSEGV